MDPAVAFAIRSKGGKANKGKCRGHQWTAEEAKKAGAKGGSTTAARYGPDYYRALGQRTRVRNPLNPLISKIAGIRSGAARRLRRLCRKRGYHLYPPGSDRCSSCNIRKSKADKHPTQYL